MNRNPLLHARRTVRVLSVATVILALTLTGCSKDSNSDKTPSASGTAESSSSPSGNTEPSGEPPATGSAFPSPNPISKEDLKNLGPLGVPVMANGPIRQPVLPPNSDREDANKEFGEEYTMNAFKFAVGFAHFTSAWPAMFNPKRPPLQEDLWSLEPFLAGDALNSWMKAEPKILAGEQEENSAGWAVVARPARDAAGRPTGRQKGLLIPAPPYAISQTLSKGYSWVCYVAGEKKVCLQFILDINVAYGEPGKAASWQLTKQKEYLFVIGDNPDPQYRAQYPLAIYGARLIKDELIDYKAFRFGNPSPSP